MDEHDVWRASFFAGTASGPRRPRREVRGPYTGARPHAHAVAFPVSVTTSTSSHDSGGGGPSHGACHGGLHVHAR